MVLRCQIWAVVPPRGAHLLPALNLGAKEACIRAANRHISSAVHCFETLRAHDGRGGSQLEHSTAQHLHGGEEARRHRRDETQPWPATTASASEQ